MAPKSIAVLGGTGNLGVHLVKGLAESSRGYVVKVLSGNESKAKKLFSGLSNVQVVKVDYEDAAALEQAFEGVDVVVSAVGVPGLTPQPKYIDAAEKAGVKWFIPSEFGCDTQAPYLKNEPVFGYKRKSVDHIKSKKDMAYTVVATGFFFDEEQGGLLGIKPKSREATIFGSESAKLTVTRRQDVGKYLAEIIAHPEVSQNRTVRVGGDLTSQGEILSKVQAKFGSDGWTVKRLSDADLEAAGMQLAVFLVVSRGMAQIDRKEPGYENALDNAKFPNVKPATVDEVIQKYTV